MSFTTSKVILLLNTLISHCATAVTATEAPILKKMTFRAEKSTCPLSTIQSMASPTRMGTYSVNPTVTIAKTKVSEREKGYFPT